MTTPLVYELLAHVARPRILSLQCANHGDCGAFFREAFRLWPYWNDTTGDVYLIYIQFHLKRIGRHVDAY
jgi:hypothetical protein